MELRPARLEDLPSLLELYRDLNPEDPPLEELRAKAIWAQIQQHPGILYLVAVDGERVVSTCHVTVVPNLTRSGRSYALVENLVTAPDHRRRGLAKALLELAVEHARRCDCYKISLLSSAKRIEAHRFYESVGFDGSLKKGFHRTLE